MPLTVPYFRLKYPEFAPILDDAIIQACLDEAALVVDLNACPDLADLMQGAYAAHCIAKSSNNPGGKDDAPSAVQSKSVGSVSVSYAVATSSSPGVSDDWYRSTMYGLNFMRFRNLCFPAVMVAP